MDGRKIAGVVIGLLVFAGVMALRFRARASDSDTVRIAATLLVISMDEYEQNQKILDAMTERAHTVAFGEAYSMAGRRTKARFDEDKYLDVFFRSMVSQAGELGRPDLKKPLLALRQELDAPDDKEGTSQPPDAQAAAAVDVDHAEDAEREDQSARTPESIAAIPDAELESALLSQIQDEIDSSSADSEPKAVRALSAGQRMLYLTTWVDRVATDHGFEALFNERFGPLATEAVQGFDRLGAKKHARLLRRAIAAFVRSSPDQAAIRKTKNVKKYLNSYDDADPAALSQEYRKLKDDLGGLRIAYIRAHPDEFTTGTGSGAAPPED
jgi:hypothetical protein